jgi:hypothetical protein
MNSAVIIPSAALRGIAPRGQRPATLPFAWASSFMRA